MRFESKKAFFLMCGLIFLSVSNYARSQEGGVNYSPEQLEILKKHLDEREGKLEYPDLVQEYLRPSSVTVLYRCITEFGLSSKMPNGSPQNAPYQKGFKLSGNIDSIGQIKNIKVTPETEMSRCVAEKYEYLLMPPAKDKAPYVVEIDLNESDIARKIWQSGFMKDKDPKTSRLFQTLESCIAKGKLIVEGTEKDSGYHYRCAGGYSGYN